MTKLFLKLGLLALLVNTYFTGKAQVLIQNLNQAWQFRQSGGNWLAAKVPGEVHLDLMANQLIADPFFGNNEKEVQWVERQTWEYRSEFKVSEEIMKRKNISLVFEGLDTYADVYLNDKLILSADNMFRSWKVDVARHLTTKMNKLLVVFYSAQNRVDSLAKANLPFVIPDNPRAYARKAQFHFGWDWGPKLTTAGIWRPIRLEGFDQPKNEKPYQVPVKVELVQQDGAFGQSFYFKVDGKPIYMKGANYIPGDAFVTRMQKSDYRKLLEMAKQANMNMLRVWGGGIYEHDDFYDLCDSLGIYVWQDFMFAGAMVPGDEAFFANVKQEVYDQVKRLRRHKSILLWCGNNEIDEAWNRWGWQKSFKINGQDSAKLWNDYKRLFQDSIPTWLKSLDPDRPYISSSPKLGWGVKESLKMGDSHYWGVWWGEEDFEVFEHKTGRFVSEYGIQAMPDFSAVLNYTDPDQRFLFSKQITNHQKAGNGFAKLNGYLHRYFLDSTQIKKLSLENYVYLTQCLQYYGFKNMILMQMAKKPYNMGTLLWQLNDCWPVASWSITNYSGRKPKAAWYAVKDAYSDKPRPQDTLRPKDFKLSDPKISFRWEKNNLILKSQNDAALVFVDLKGYTGVLSDNYFSLTAGEEKVIHASGLKAGHPLQIKSLWDVLQSVK